MIAVVCAYFNPFQSKAREQAYLHFRNNLEQLGARVLCVEQIFPGVPSISRGGDIVVSGGHLLWQKECLLQIGIDKALEEGYELILISDADILFETPNALALIESSFVEFDYFQPFETVIMEYSESEIRSQSVMSLGQPRPYGSGHPGSCWAARPTFLKKVRLYPFAILGGGDIAMTHLSAAAIHYGPNSDRFHDLCRYYSDYVLYPNLFDSLKEWGWQFMGTSFRIGYTIGVQIRSQNHGSYKLRKYHERYDIWRKGALSNSPRPMIDFGLGDSGLLEWTLTPNNWQNYVREYFTFREANA